MANIVSDLKVSGVTYDFGDSFSNAGSVNSVTIDDTSKHTFYAVASGSTFTINCSYAPSAGTSEEFLVAIRCNAACTISLPDSGYTVREHLYNGTNSISIPAPASGSYTLVEVAITVGSHAANNTYLSTMCQLKGQNSIDAIVPAVIDRLGNSYIPMTGTAAGTSVSGNVKFTDGKGLVNNSGTNVISYTNSSVGVVLGAEGTRTAVAGNLQVIGTTNMASTLTVTGATTLNSNTTTTNILPKSHNAYDIGSSSTQYASVYATAGRFGTGFATNGFFETSDERLKNIHGDIDLDKAYELVEKCSTILYDLKDDEEHKVQLGVVAQEIKEIFPELVNENEEGFLSVDYSRLTVVILRVLKSIIERINKLENK